MNKGGWIGVDLDGTLAQYGTWVSAIELFKLHPTLVMA